MSEAAPARLSPRAREVARLVALGLTNRQIAQHLSIAERTVEWHVDQILNRLGFSTRSQVAAWVGRTEPSVAVRGPGSRVRGNLPAPLTRFVGRQRDLAALRKLVARSRLVTVAGPGGIGKTRLALRLAEELEPSTADGVWLCTLAAAKDSDSALDAIFSLVDEDDLRDVSVVLVLDTCEHLLPGLASRVEALLERCPGVRLLATSRTPLGLAGEAVWRVAPLIEADAVRLFMERASEAAPDLDLDMRADEVAALCAQLGGIPLALELAASKLRVQRLGEIARPVLGDLGAVTDWSYRLLSADAQRTFRCVSVFGRWFDAEDEAAVVPGGHGAAITELVESSMLIYERDRYRMLEVLRPHAARLLEECGEAGQARLAHAERMVALAERLDLRRDDATPDTWQRAASMIDDLRAAMAVLLRERPQRAAWLAACLMQVWRDTGRLEEGLRWSEAALGAVPDASRERCSLLHAHALLLYWLGRREAADLSFLEAVALTALPDCDSIRGELLVRSALAHSCRGEWKKSEAAQREAIAIFSANAQEQNAARALNHLALSLLYQRRLDEASELAERSLELRRKRGTRIEPALDTAAQARALLGDLDGAERRWLEAGRLVLGEGDETGAACSLTGLAYVSAMRGRQHDALRLHYCAQRLLVDGGVVYDEPLGPDLMRSVNNLESSIAAEELEHLRSEGAALSAAGAMLLAGP